jgi:hypothetical protein
MSNVLRYDYAKVFIYDLKDSEPFYWPTWLKTTSPWYRVVEIPNVTLNTVLWFTSQTDREKTVTPGIILDFFVMPNNCNLHSGHCILLHFFISCWQFLRFRLLPHYKTSECDNPVHTNDKHWKPYNECTHSILNITCQLHKKFHYRQNSESHSTVAAVQQSERAHAWYIQLSYVSLRKLDSWPTETFPCMDNQTVLTLNSSFFYKLQNVDNNI